MCDKTDDLSGDQRPRHQLSISCGTITGRARPASRVLPWRYAGRHPPGRPDGQETERYVVFCRDGASLGELLAFTGEETPGMREARYGRPTVPVQARPNQATEVSTQRQDGLFRLGVAELTLMPASDGQGWAGQPERLWIGALQFHGAQRAAAAVGRTAPQCWNRGTFMMSILPTLVGSRGYW